MNTISRLNKQIKRKGGGIVNEKLKKGVTNTVTQSGSTVLEDILKIDYQDGSKYQGNLI